MASRLGNIRSAYARNQAVGAAQHQGAVNAAKMRPTGPPKGLTSAAPPKGLTPPSGAAPLTTPPASSSAPMPWDANYESRVGGINRNRDTTLAGLQTEETGVKQAYGFDDLSNPFSKLALLKEKFANSQRGDLNSAAASGQLWNTAYGAQKAETQHGQDINYDALRRDYDADLGSITARRTTAKNTAEDDTTDAGWDRTQTALANRPDPASLPAATAAPEKGATTPFTSKPGVNSKGEPGVWHTYTDGRKPVFVRK